MIVDIDDCLTLSLLFRIRSSFVIHCHDILCHTTATLSDYRIAVAGQLSYTISKSQNFWLPNSFSTQHDDSPGRILKLMMILLKEPEPNQK